MAMKTQNQNPLIKRHSHLLAEDGKYPAEHVDIFWNTELSNVGNLIKNVEVVFAPRPRSREDANDFSEYYKRWRYDLGNSCSDWLKEGGLTPAEIFGFMLWSGFLNRDEMVSALREFAHIVECDWARSMLWGYTEG
jgi:hypothetical protein